MIEGRVLCWWLILITARDPTLDSTNLITPTPTTKHKAKYVCLRMWKCDLGDYIYPLPASWSHCPLGAAYCTTAGCVIKSPKKFENMDSLRFYSQNSNPVWAHNGTCELTVKALKGDDRKCGHRVWTQDFMQLKRGTKKKKNVHLCAHVFLGVQEMLVWGHWCVPSVPLVTGGVLI